MKRFYIDEIERNVELILDDVPKPKGGDTMALPRRLQLKLERKIEKQNEIAINRWLMIGFFILAITEVTINYVRG